MCLVTLPFPGRSFVMGLSAIVGPGPDATGNALWPSGLALAWAISRGDLELPLTGQALDLGCGSGLVALALAEKAPSLRVWAGDSASEAIEHAARNARRNRLDVSTLRLDWRFSGDRRFDRITLADGLYREESGPEVARFVRGALTTEGVAWITDPDRHSARHFHYQAADEGLSVTERRLAVPFVDGHGPLEAVRPELRPGRLSVQLYELRLAG